MVEKIIGFHLERKLLIQALSKGIKTSIPGIDEAGRGPLAGPVVAAAVLFPKNWIEEDSFQNQELSDLNDSKKLSERNRERLFGFLTTHADIRFSIGIVEASEIDKVNILEATKIAMKSALDGLMVENYIALVDGLPLKPSPFIHESVIKGDSKSYTIAAASIIAKVTRDRIMEQADKDYPGYGFGKHKGYGTKEHLEALKRFGPTPLHRHSFAPLRQEQLEMF